MRFKYRKSMKLPYRRQGYIFFRCQNLTEEQIQDVKTICDKTGYGDAIYEYITTNADSIYICNKHFISHMLLATKTAEAFRELNRIL